MDNCCSATEFGTVCYTTFCGEKITDTYTKLLIVPEQKYSFTPSLFFFLKKYFFNLCVIHGAQVQFCCINILHCDEVRAFSIFITGAIYIVPTKQPPTIQPRQSPHLSKSPLYIIPYSASTPITPFKDAIISAWNKSQFHP